MFLSIHCILKFIKSRSQYFMLSSILLKEKFAGNRLLSLDDIMWITRVKHYKKLLPAIGTDKLRNVMDMNSLYGGFAAAMANYSLWVMNIVSSYSLNTLAGVIEALLEPIMTGVKLSILVLTIFFILMVISLLKVRDKQERRMVSVTGGVAAPAFESMKK